jgi:hypothetical protein
MFIKELAIVRRVMLEKSYVHISISETRLKQQRLKLLLCEIFINLNEQYFYHNFNKRRVLNIPFLLVG